MERESNNDFFIWGIDDAPYGPVELPALVSWIKDERVFEDTWIYARREKSWRRAGEFSELQMFFSKKEKMAEVSSDRPASGMTPGAMRRIKILAEFSDAQLDHLSQYLELQRVQQWATIVKQGDTGDAMYFVIEGEVRARVVVNGKETILATFGPGDFFGDMSLFDHGPRSADVVANHDSTVLRITASNFERLAREAPALATPFLQATARTLSARIRADNKRLSQARQFSASTM